jgi:outer membrane protein assembly factor BamB
MPLRTLLIALVLVTATGCTTVKGWLSDDKAKALAPAPLVDIAGTIAPKASWTVDLGDNQAKLGLRQRPAIDGDRLFVSNDSGRVLAISTTTGDTLWDSEVVKTGKQGSRLFFWRRKATEAGLTGGPGVGAGLVVVGGRNGEVVALDTETGAERWKTTVTSEVISSPLVAGGLVVVRSGDGRTFGLDAADGSRKWVFDRGLPSLSVRGNGSPVAGGEMIYLGYDDGAVIALRMADGLRAWEQMVAQPDGRNELERLADVDGELQVGDTDLYATSFRGQTMAIALATARPTWTRDVGSYGGLGMSIDKVVLADNNGTVWALDRAGGTAMWKQEALARRWLTTPAVQGDYVVVGDVEGYLHWLNLVDGQIVGRVRADRSPILATPQVTASGTLVVLTSDGELSAYPQP